MLLHEVVVSSTHLTLQSCSTAFELGIGQNISCAGTYSVRQADIEAGQVVIGAAGSSPTLPVGSQIVQALPAWTVPVDVNPQLVVDVVAAGCQQVNITCELV